MEINGKIIECLALQTGKSSYGEWRKQEYIIETNGQYPKKICFLAWGEKIEQFAIQQGETLQVSIDLESREYNGRWYTDVKAWKVSRDAVGAGVSDSEAGKNDGYGSLASSGFLNDDVPF